MAGYRSPSCCEINPPTLPSAQPAMSRRVFLSLRRAPEWTYPAEPWRTSPQPDRRGLVLD